MSTALLPDPIMQWFDNAGKPLANGSVYTYAAGSTTFLPVYSDAAGLVPLPQGFRLDASGKATVYLSAATYRFDVQDANGVSIDGYPRDNVFNLLPVLPVTLGGTGDTLLTAHGVLVGNDVNPVSVTGAGVAGQVLTSNGPLTDPTFQPLPVATIVDRQVTLQTVVNTVAETAVYTFAVTGGSLSTNRTLHLSLIGDMLNNSGAGATVTIRIKFGATVVATFVFTNVNTSANRSALTLDVEITAAGLTNAQRSKAILFFDGVGDANATGTAVTRDLSGGAGTGVTYLGGVYNYTVNNAIAEDSTVSKNLVITYQLGSANAAFDARAHTVYTELK